MIYGVKRVVISASASTYLAPHILKRDFIDCLTESLFEYPAVTATLLELEVLESVSINNIELAVQRLEQCRALGMKIALDDFGTGFASLNYLKMLPLDTLKIDRSFIQNIEEDKADEAIVKSMIEFGKVFNYRLIAEGVETKAQLKKFQSLGGVYVQGFYFAKPMEGKYILHWIKNNKFQCEKQA